MAIFTFCCFEPELEKKERRKLWDDENFRDPGYRETKTDSIKVKDIEVNSDSDMEDGRKYDFLTNFNYRVELLVMC